MRGLKPVTNNRAILQTVASFTDAWIETKGKNYVNERNFSRIFYRCVDWNLPIQSHNSMMDESHLLQMRGLKQNIKSTSNESKESHLLQMRGLKQNQSKRLVQRQSRIFYRCVDWNKNLSYAREKHYQSHLLQMRGLKPLRWTWYASYLLSHLLQMRGLKRR